MRNATSDVIIIGAGLSGIGAACRLKTECPDRSVRILEARDAIGGTWDLFRYPGIRSDSDMHTLGYDFEPWRDAKAIADGPSILNYVRETARKHGVDSQIRFGQRVTNASWVSEDAMWHIMTRDSKSGAQQHYSCRFLLVCAGYYRYEHGFTPDFPGQERFQGEVIHPQQWPDSLDYSGKRIVVIGSGATAVTLVPALAAEAAGVTMLQRSPSYIFSQPDTDRIANVLRKLLPERLAYAVTRWKNVTFQQTLYRQTRVRPKLIRRLLLRGVRKELGPDYDVATHFSPHYNPWDQRMCLVPNGDLFAAIRSGRAAVETGDIETFTETGIRLRSGRELDADIIVTATGLDLVVLGETQFEVDGRPIDFPTTFTYKGIMYSGVPNMISTFGYINSSWTLRADLIARFACRVLNHMRNTGAHYCTPTLRDDDQNMQPAYYIENFSAGYMQRMLRQFARQGDRPPWLNPQNYRKDRKAMLRDPVDDGVLIFQ